jgi:hypothetical protein
LHFFTPINFEITEFQPQFPEISTWGSYKAED